MFPLPEFQHDASHAIDVETAPRDPLEMPLFPPSSPGRGRAGYASIDRVHAHTRAFSHSPHPTYPGELDNHFVPRHNHSHSDLGFINSRSSNGPIDHYLPSQSTAAMEDFFDASLMAAQYLDLPTHCSPMHQNDFPRSYLSDSSASSPEATDTASSSSPRAEIFSAHSSPGHLMSDLPDKDTPRSSSGFGRHPPSLHYLGPYAPPNRVDTRYQDSLLLPRPTSHHEPPVHHRQANNWGYNDAPGSMPFISQNSRYTMSRPPSPSASHILNTFGQYPVPEDVRRWPQAFKINQVKKVGNKKQMMACLFCRERKIGCARPPEDDPDQTCNQCARRKRKCEYPTESRRGQHTRNRLNAKKLIGLEPKITPVTPPKLPTAE